MTTGVDFIALSKFARPTMIGSTLFFGGRHALQARFGSTYRTANPGLRERRRRRCMRVRNHNPEDPVLVRNRAGGTSNKSCGGGCSVASPPYETTSTRALISRSRVPQLLHLENLGVHRCVIPKEGKGEMQSSFWPIKNCSGNNMRCDWFISPLNSLTQPSSVILEKKFFAASFQKLQGRIPVPPRRGPGRKFGSATAGPTRSKMGQWAA